MRLIMFGCNNISAKYDGGNHRPEILVYNDMK